LHRARSRQHPCIQVGTLFAGIVATRPRATQAPDCLADSTNLERQPLAFGSGGERALVLGTKARFRAIYLRQRKRRRRARARQRK
jgi:hypothetical protein